MHKTVFYCVVFVLGTLLFTGTNNLYFMMLKVYMGTELGVSTCIGCVSSIADLLPPVSIKTAHVVGTWVCGTRCLSRIWSSVAAE